MIDQPTIDRILDAAQIYDVVSDFVTLRKRGVNYVGLCPFHDDKTPSFYVSPAKGLCKCFACGKGGNAVHFIMEHEQMSYPEALKYLAKKYGIEIKERELSSEEKIAQGERESLFIVNNFARDYFQNILKNHVDGRSIGMAYFRSRGFRDDIIEKFQLGYCTESHDALAQEALKKGYKKDYLVKTGLCYETDDHRLRDRFWGRVIFPVHTLSGKVVAFGGRVLAGATKGVKVKYVNSPESEIYHKSNELYGIYFAKQAIVKQDRCFLVEGYTDVISMHQSGIENVVASSGTALTSGQIRMIHRFTNNMTVLYDGDAAGIKASIRGIDMLLEEGMNVKVCLLPDGDDPDSFARKHNATEFQAFIQENETDFIRFKTNLLLEDAGKDPIKRAELIGNLVQSISIIPEAIVRDVYIKECAQLLHVEDKLLVSEVAKRREKQAEHVRRHEADRGIRADQRETRQVHRIAEGERRRLAGNGERPVGRHRAAGAQRGQPVAGHGLHVRPDLRRDADAHTSRLGRGHAGIVGEIRRAGRAVDERRARLGDLRASRQLVQRRDRGHVRRTGADSRPRWHEGSRAAHQAAGQHVIRHAAGARRGRPVARGQRQLRPGHRAAQEPRGRTDHAEHRGIRDVARHPRRGGDGVPGAARSRARPSVRRSAVADAAIRGADRQIRAWHHHRSRRDGGAASRCGRDGSGVDLRRGEPDQGGHPRYARAA